MQADFWHDRWALGQVGFHKDDINPNLQRHWGNLGAAAGTAVFVPLCGKSAHKQAAHYLKWRDAVADWMAAAPGAALRRPLSVTSWLSYHVTDCRSVGTF